MTLGFKSVEQKIVNEIAATLDNIAVEEVEELVAEIEKAERVFFVGVGRVLLSLEGIAKRLAHLGFKQWW